MSGGVKALNRSHVIGKVIKSVDMEKIAPDNQASRSGGTGIARINFTDGSYIYFSAMEDEVDHWVLAAYVPKKRSGG